MSEPVLIKEDSFFNSNELYESKKKTGNEFEFEEPSSFNFHSEVLSSVFLNDESNNTPMFDELDLVLEGSKKEDWSSLFDANDEVESNQLVTDEDLIKSLEPNNGPSLESHSEDSRSSSTDIERIEQSPQLPPSTGAQLMTPNPSSTLSTPVLDGYKKRKATDHLGCVKYSKKQRAQDLDPVDFDSKDPGSMKRAKNTEAARRSRARKMERMKQLEDRVEELMDENVGLSEELARFRQLLEANNIKY